MSGGKASEYFSLSKNQVENLIAQLNLGSDEDGKIRSVYTLNVDAATWESVPAIRDAVAYLGFDPRKIIGEFIKKAKDNARSADDKPKTYGGSGGTFVLYERNDAETDLLFFITLFLERGNNITKMLLKCDREIGDLIRRKTAAYGIIMDRKQGETILGTSSLTLARISQAFPIATAALILKNNIPGKLKTKALVGVTALPTLMQHTIFPGLIPTDDEVVTEPLKDIALVLNIETSILLATPKERRKLEQKDVDELQEQAEQFVSAAMDGSLVSDEMKKIILKKAQVLNAEGGLTDIVTACAAAARAFLSLGSKTFSKAIKQRVQELEKAAAPNL